MKATLNFSVNAVSTRDKDCVFEGESRACFEAQLCALFTSHRSKDSDSVTFLISSDTIATRRGSAFGRVFFDEVNDALIERRFTIFRDKETCFLLPKILVKDEDVDKLTPLEFSVALLKKEEERTSFCPDCPVTRGRTNWTSTVYFENGCGSDSKCVSILQVGAIPSIKSVQVDSIVSGEYDTLDIEVKVTNTGERSYGTRATLEITPALNVYRTDQGCTFKKDLDINKTTIDCDAGNPLETAADIMISLDTTDLDPRVKAIIVQTSLSSASEVDPQSETRSEISVPVLRQASVAIEACVLLPSCDCLVVSDSFPCMHSQHVATRRVRVSSKT